ncbi:hypothetical protein [Terriglobus aquaticus]|uniref:Uncharacterized protein n=1 Tax=Terriglobus aquaticus TaxID=940139 RepID=A0ABW9KHT1_9BACT|nr:hypothetical protein [Terriglobus aquaticus]
MRLLAFSLLSLPLCVTLAGCKSTPADVAAANLERSHQVDRARQDLQQIPPPSKALYLNVQRLEDWHNPSLTVQEKMISIHVTEPDANPSDLGKGTMLRPEAARQQVLNVDAKDLPQALNAIPKEAWPYGRVVAIEEARDAPASARPQLRRNIESALDTLTSIGVVADEWSENRPVGNR